MDVLKTKDTQLLRKILAVASILTVISFFLPFATANTSNGFLGIPMTATGFQLYKLEGMFSNGISAIGVLLYSSIAAAAFSLFSFAKKKAVIGATVACAIGTALSLITLLSESDADIGIITCGLAHAIGLFLSVKIWRLEKQQANEEQHPSAPEK